MSVRLMNAVFENAQLGPTERLVMLALADHHNDKDGSCYPSIERLCARTGLSKRAVQNNIQRLSEAGHLTVKGSTGRGNANSYIIHIKGAADAHIKPEKGAADAPFNETKGAADAPFQGKKGASDTGKGASGSIKGASGAPQPLGTLKEPVADAREKSSSLQSEPRVQLLAAMGIGPDGVTGPSKFIGTTLDMAEAERWREMGVTLPKQCEIIGDVCRRKRSREPNWSPSRFSYFTPAMREVVQVSSQPVESQKASQIEKWRKIASGK